MPGNVIFNSGERTKRFTLTANQDTVDEQNESLTLEFGALPTRVSAGSPATATVRITDAVYSTVCTEEEITSPGQADLLIWK